MAHLTPLSILTVITLYSLTALSSTARASRSEFDEMSIMRVPVVSPILAPDGVFQAEGPNPLVLTVVRADHGSATAVEGLPFNFSTPNGKVRLTTDAQGMIRIPFQCTTKTIHAVAELVNNQFQVRNSNERRNYQLVVDVPCTGSTQLAFKSDSNAGQALGIWQIAMRARARLNEAIGLQFWQSRITFSWPSDGDYYLSGEVHLTRGDYWDVVGHEMGHAIYDLGQLGRFGSGAHKIDECYSRQLALSEGWASFFSAWVSVDLADPDAHFEYMVPRRAPLRFENIPADVCKGETNEWRTTGFFWDLIDRHDESGDVLSENFAKLWNAMERSRVSSPSEAMGRFEKAGIDVNALRAAWELNFQTPAVN